MNQKEQTTKKEQPVIQSIEVTAKPDLTWRQKFYGFFFINTIIYALLFVSSFFNPEEINSNIKNLGWLVICIIASYLLSDRKLKYQFF